MFNKIVDFSIKNRLVIVLAYLLIFFYGFSTIKEMEVDVFPDLNRPQVSLIVEAEGLAPEEIEKQVTIPIENNLNGATNVTRVFSNSSIGYSIIKAEFEWDTNIYTARQIINERMGQVTNSLPGNVTVTMGPISSIMGEILTIGLSSPDNSVSAMRLREIADWDIKKRLLAISGVSQVSNVGGDIKEYQVILNANKLRLNNITLDNIRSALSNVGENTNGGFSFGSYTEKLIRNIARPQTIADIENTIIPIPNNIGAPSLTVKKIAKVEIAPQINPRGQASINANNGVILSISKQPNIDSIDLTNRLEKELDAIESSLPKGVVLTKNIFKQASFITKAIDNIEESLSLGSLLIAIVLFMFLLNLRTTAIVLLVIPSSFIMTGIIFNAFDLSINTMTLGGLAMAIGSLVDDAIVAVSNCFKKLKENKNKEKSEREDNETVVYSAIKEVINSIIFSTVLVFLSLLPLFALKGMEGKIFTPLALAFIISMICSMFVAITLTPVLSFYFIPSIKSLGKSDSIIVKTLKNIHHIALDFCFKYYKSILSVIIGLFVFSIFLTTQMGKEFLPPFNEGSFNISLSTPPTTSITEMTRVSTLAQKKLLEIPEIASIGARTGRAEVDEHALGVNVTEMEVRIKDDSKKSKEELIDIIRAKLNFPGVFINIGQPISHRIDFILSGIRSQIAVKIFGHDLGQIQELAQEAKIIMETIDGVKDLSVEQQVLIPQIHFELNRDKAIQYGINAGDMSQDIQTALSGEKLGTIIEDDRFYDITMRLDDKIKDDLGNLPIESINGYFVPLKAITKISEKMGHNQISRENGKRRIVVQANVGGRDLVSTANEIKEKLYKELKLPQGYFISFDGQYESQAKASKDITILSILTFILIYAGLYLNTKSLNLATQLMSVIPLSLIGAVIGVWFSSSIISIATIIGFITLIGIAIRNGILLIDLYQSQEKRLSKNELISLTGDRLVPVMMTTLTSILGFIPLILDGSSPGKEILYPTAIVIASGLITSTLLNLLITPVIYDKFYQKD